MLQIFVKHLIFFFFTIVKIQKEKHVINYNLCLYNRQAILCTSLTRIAMIAGDFILLGVIPSQRC